MSRWSYSKMSSNCDNLSSRSLNQKLSSKIIRICQVNYQNMRSSNFHVNGFYIGGGLFRNLNPLILIPTLEKFSALVIFSGESKNIQNYARNWDTAPLWNFYFWNFKGKNPGNFFLIFGQKISNFRPPYINPHIWLKNMLISIKFYYDLAIRLYQ